MNEKVGITLTGEVHDSIKFVTDGEVILPNGEVVLGKAGEVIDLPIVYNTIVNSFHTLVAMLIKGEQDLVNNLWWEVGSGSDSWVDTALPSASVTDTKLLNPTFRKKVDYSNITYLDVSTGNVTANPSPIIQVNCIFQSGEANGHLREFSLYLGGNNVLGSGRPINRKIHGVIFKTSGIELQRRIHFHFKGADA